MKIGIPAETLPGEQRVATTPEVVKKLVAKGFTILIESGAGTAACYPDAEFAAAGAQLVDRSAVFDADLVLKVRRPTADEAAAVRTGTVYISLLESCGADALVAEMTHRGVQVLGMERMPRISRAQAMDALSSQSNIAGYRAVIEAAAHNKRFFPAMMTAAGAAKPARVVVLGAGVAGLQAIATARRLGADVHAYDVRPETREQILSLGAKPIELDLGESGAGAGGYARELSAEAKAKQQAALANELVRAQVIITTALIPCRPAPELITTDVIERLRPGAVVVDLAAANGGNCKLTVADQVIEHQGVTLIGYTNYPSRVATDASSFYAKNLMNLLDIMVEKTTDELRLRDLQNDEITRAMLIAAD
ncbi:Re/Si-specific NAD(P)(+) transhydrogenase subunit alpha [Thiospirillum jenense]|uniref:proton-translocating NAD(P)(+) transhydrogenase n=1 Tax=Thiospirillum jenense TaxID=1653858 RepID=A0A839HEE1_9GAMM|nr:Re/Si-specific NAD(P)(+) transhydrogenase subunit alpha [Thiospirillum jenense]MBB1125379.1 Re/Si-specific NAD(P)(+) transhydrogenase subunit alpha [Thiospirillum jenense]